MGIKKLETNIPARVDHLQYADLVQGKYGPQLKLKGTMDGEADSVIYLTPAWKAGKALTEAGVLAFQGQWPGKDDKVESDTPVRIVATQFTICDRKPAGEQYSHIAIDSVGGAAPARAETPPAPPSPAAEAAHWADGVDKAAAHHSAILTAVIHGAARDLRKAFPSASEDALVTATTAITATIFIESNKRR